MSPSLHRYLILIHPPLSTPHFRFACLAWPVLTCTCALACTTPYTHHHSHSHLHLHSHSCSHTDNHAGTRNIHLPVIMHTRLVPTCHVTDSHMRCALHRAIHSCVIFGLHPPIDVTMPILFLSLGQYVVAVVSHRIASYCIPSHMFISMSNRWKRLGLGINGWCLMLFISYSPLLFMSFHFILLPLHLDVELSCHQWPILDVEC